MQVRVEFYGVARQRAQRSQLTVELPGSVTTLGHLLAEVARLLPEFGRECVTANGLQPALAMNLDGQRFVSDLAAPISDGQCLLILSADAGG